MAEKTVIQTAYEKLQLLKTASELIHLFVCGNLTDILERMQDVFSEEDLIAFSAYVDHIWEKIQPAAMEVAEFMESAGKERDKIPDLRLIRGGKDDK